MQGGGGVVDLARKAAASSRTEWAARVAAAAWPERHYVGVRRRLNRYSAMIWDNDRGRPLWLGSYGTPEEAAYAFDAASRAMRGHRARTNFPPPAFAPAPPGDVSTDLVLALPTRAARARVRVRDRSPAAAVAAQACFDNWLLSASAAAEAEPQPQHQLLQQGAPAPALPPPPHHQPQRTVPLPPFTQFFHLADPAAVDPSVPGAYVLTPQNVQQVPPTIPAASTELSCTDPVVNAFEFLPPAPAPAPAQPPVVSQAGVSDDLADVADNFFIIDGASSPAARPSVPRFRLDLLLHVGLPGLGGPGGGAQ